MKRLKAVRKFNKGSFVKKIGRLVQAGAKSLDTKFAKAQKKLKLDAAAIKFSARVITPADALAYCIRELKKYPLAERPETQDVAITLRKVPAEYVAKTVGDIAKGFNLAQDEAKVVFVEAAVLLYMAKEHPEAECVRELAGEILAGYPPGSPMRRFAEAWGRQAR